MNTRAKLVALAGLFTLTVTAVTAWVAEPPAKMEARRPAGQPQTRRVYSKDPHKLPMVDGPQDRLDNWTAGEIVSRSIIQDNFTARSGLGVSSPAPGIRMATTAYEYQHNDAAPQQIATNGSGRYIHFAWTHMDTPPVTSDWSARRVNFSTYDPGTGSFRYPSPGVTVSGGGGNPSQAHAGYVTLAVDDQDRAILSFHQRSAAHQPLGTLSSWVLEQFAPSFPVFTETYLLGSEGAVEDSSILWPHLTVDQRPSAPDFYHVVAHYYRSDRICYWRYDGAVWVGPVLVDSSPVLSYNVAADRTSDKIALITNDEDTTVGNPHGLRQVTYRESLDNGTSWINGTGLGDAHEVFITSYNDPHGPCAWMQCIGDYDNSGNLHVVWIEQRFANTSLQAALKHWDKLSNRISAVHTAYYENEGWDPVRDLHLSFPTIGFGDGSTTCSGQPNSDFLYITFMQFGGPSVAQQSDMSARQYMNGDIYLSSSNDGGASWAPAANLTSSPSPGCDPATGDSCNSDVWPSVARTVDDTIHLMYIADRDAGNDVQAQGTWTFNPVMYYRIPGGTDAPLLCPPLAPNFAAELSDADHTDCGFTTAPGTVLNETLTLSNLGTSSLTGVISVVPSAPWLTVTGAGQYTIPPGDPGLTFPVSMNATAMAESLYHADIQITHNDPTKASPILIPVDFVVQDSLKPNFVAFPVSGRVPLTVMFEPTHLGAATGFLWRFGDGSTSTLRNPIHTYTTPWVYDVRLLVSLDVGGCHRQDSIIKPVYITASSLRAQFAAEPKTGPIPLSVQFTDQSDGHPAGWYWDFGDGQFSTAQHPSHEYTTIGAFNVFLRVTDADGKADSVLKLDLIRTDSILFADLVAELWGSRPRPGFNFTVWSSWTNQGSVVADNCTLRTLLPSEASLVLVNASAGYFKTGSYSGYSFAGDTIVIPLGSIAATARFGGYIPIIAHLPPTVPIGTVIRAEAWLSSSTAEASLGNNCDTLELTVVGSEDPNDKSALPEGEGLDRTIGRMQRLTYKIDFENKATATAEAIYILVIDTLDPNLDWGSLAEGPSSHPDRCKMSLDPYTGVITYFCDSIMLPPNQNPPEGEGYFTFSISPPPGLPNGARISNRAHIRFDYNAFMAAPDSGPVVRTIHFCDCSHQGDLAQNGFIDVSDVLKVIGIAFVNGADTQDPECPKTRGDVNNDGVVDVNDVLYIIKTAFVNGPPPVDPCL